MGIVRAVLLVTLVAAGGCHRWVPHDGSPVPAGTEVRVRVTDAGSDDLQRRYGPNDGSLTGPVVAWDSDGVSLLDQTILRRPGFPSTVVSDTISLPANHLAGVDVKELDGKRTALLTAGILVAGGSLVWATRAFGESSGPNEGGPTEPPEASIGIRLPLGLGWR